MIQYVALALAVSALNSNESEKKKSNSHAPLIVVRPVLLKKHFLKPKNYQSFNWFQKLWARVNGRYRLVLETEPWAELAVKTSHIVKLEKRMDDRGTEYVVIHVSDDARVFRDDDLINYLRIPGSIAEVAGIINQAQGSSL